MIGFYIFGTANFQDMLPVLFEYLKQGKDCWIAFFDCFYKKRQLYHYTKNEIIEFLPILREYSDKEVILIFIVVFLSFSG